MFDIQIVAVISIFFIMLSTVALTLNTLPSMQMYECRNETDTECDAELVSSHICYFSFTLK